MTWWSGSAAVRRQLLQLRRLRDGIDKVCASSAFPPRKGTAAQAAAANIPLTTFSEHRQIDLTIDGADEVERGTLNLIKGLGGALLREKIVAAASHRLTIVVDGSKLVDRLGTHAPVPVEVAAFGLEATRESLEVLGANDRHAHVVRRALCVMSSWRVRTFHFGSIVRRGCGQRFEKSSEPRRQRGMR